MNILTTNKMQRYLSVFVLMIVSFQFIQETTYAEVYSPVIIEPYDEASLEKINRSFTSIKTYMGKVMADGTALKEAAKNNAANPTLGNGAELIEKTGRSINTSVEFLNKSEAALGRAIPEIRKYKEHLRKMAKSMGPQSGNASFSGETKWAEAEVKALESFINEMEEMRDHFKKMKQDYAAVSSAWVHSTQIKRELKAVFNDGKIGSIRKEIAQSIEAIYETRSLIMDQLKESSISNSTGSYEDGKDAYRSAINKYFDN